MAYFDGFIIPAPTADTDAFLDHANRMDAIFLEFGATRVVEGWAGDVPHGQVTDFYRAVQAKEDETIVFSWIEWPDKAARDAGMKRMESDERMMAEPMPFDGKRMIFGGFAPLLDEGEGSAPGYINGFIVAVPDANKEAYVTMANFAAAVFREYGASRVVEAWGDDVPDGKVTDFRRAVQATKDEAVVFSWIEWPSRQVHDDAWPKIMADERMKPDPANMPFDGKRMIYGGFTTVVELEAGR